MRTFAVFAAALIAATMIVAWSPGRAITQERKVSQSNSPLRTGKDAIQKELANKTSLDFVEVSLRNAIDHIKQRHQIEIHFDSKVLNDAAFDPDKVPITCILKNVSLKSALKWMFRELNLVAVVRDDVLLITTQDNANSILETRVCDVRELLPAGGKDPADYENLIKLIQSVIAPQTWSDMGGRGTVMQGLFGTLVITQTDEFHADISDLFSALRRFKEQVKAGKFDEAIIVGWSPFDEAVDKALIDKIDLHLRDMPLKDAIDVIRDRCHVQIQLDANALKNAALEANMPITVDAKGVTLRSALQRMLRERNLAWLIRDEALLITTKDMVDATLHTHLYPVGDLLELTAESPDQIDLSKWRADAQRLTAMLEATVAPESWSNQGGPGTLGTYGQRDMALVVRQTSEVQEEIADLLAQLREVHRKQQAEVVNQPATPPEPETMVLRVYELRISAPNSPVMSPQDVAEVVKGLVEPKSWGQGEAYLRGVTGKLVVRQLPSVHRQVEKLLAQLDVLLPKNPGITSGGGLGGGGFSVPGNAAPR